MNNDNTLTILNYLNNDWINDTLDKIITTDIIEDIAFGHLEWKRGTRRSSFNTYFFEDEEIVEQDQSVYKILEDLDVMMGDFGGGKKSHKKEFSLNDILECKKEIQKILQKAHSEGFFDEINEITALRYASIIKNINLLPEKIKEKNLIIKNAVKELQVGNIQNIINKRYFLLLNTEGFYELFANTVKDSYPNSLKKISILPEKYVEKSKINNVENQLFVEKKEKLKELLESEIKNKKYKDILYTNNLLKSICYYLIPDEDYKNFDLSKFLFENYALTYLVKQDVSFVYDELKVYSSKKIFEKYEYIINALKVYENNTEEKRFIELAEYAKNKNEYSAALSFLDIDISWNKNIKRGFITEVISKALKENSDLKVEDLKVNHLSCYDIVKDVFKKIDYSQRKDKVLDEFANGNGLEIKELETKVLEVAYEKFIYLFEKDYREQNFKGATGSFFDYKFMFDIDKEKKNVRITLRYEGVSKIKNEELLLDVIDLIDAILSRNDMAERYFNQMKLKGKMILMNTTEKTSSVRVKL